MSTLSPSTAPDMTSDATFRIWGKSISDTVIALGWAQSPDTGQINWATATKPASPWTISGFQIFESTDASSSTHKMYMRIDYGCASTTSIPFMYVRAMTATDGAGNYVGPVSGNFQIYPGAGSSTAYRSRACGGTNRIAYAIWEEGGFGKTCFFSVERTHDANGNDTTDGIMVFTGASYTDGAFSQLIPFTGTVPSSYNHWNGTLPPSGTGAIGADIYLGPVRSWGFGETGPSMNLFSYFSVDLTAETAVPATTWDGNAHTVLPLGHYFSGGQFYGATGAVAMRWD